MLVPISDSKNQTNLYKSTFSEVLGLANVSSSIRWSFCTIRFQFWTSLSQIFDVFLSVVGRARQKKNEKLVNKMFFGVWRLNISIWVAFTRKLMVFEGPRGGPGGSQGGCHHPELYWVRSPSACFAPLRSPCVLHWAPIQGRGKGKDHLDSDTLDR